MSHQNVRDAIARRNAAIAQVSRLCEQLDALPIDSREYNDLCDQIEHARREEEMWSDIADGERLVHHHAMLADVLASMPA